MVYIFLGLAWIALCTAIYAGVGWVIISALNLFMVNPVNIAVWSCILVGLALDVVRGVIKVTVKKD